MIGRRASIALSVAGALATSLAAGASAAPAGGPAAAMPRISPEAIQAHMRFLADGLLEGRAPDGRGYAIAAAYVAAQMEALGLKPAGWNGSWYQPVPMRKAVLDEERTSVTLIRDGREERLAIGEDYIAPGDGLRTATEVEAPVVFVGFGVTAPDQGYDDYKGIDVRGKILAVLYGAPARFPSTERAHYSSNLTKRQNAVARGAVGAFSIFMPEELKRYRWDWLLPQVRSGSMAWLDDQGVPNDAFPQLRGAAYLSASGAERLFQGARKSAAEVYADAAGGTLRAFALPLKARLSLASRHTGFSSSNVLGLLRGSDPKRREEIVVYTAHLDHLGICPPVKGDSVCHGAYDNASGVAAMLEIARAYVALDPAPRRSILFAAVTGEEKGLLGSDYLAAHPAVAGATVVANINIDAAPGLLYAMRDIVPLGIEHSTLKGPIEEAAREVGYEISPDPVPEEVAFIRSDQYSFVRRGVPAVFLIDGTKSATPGVDGLETFKTWLTTLYHTPADSIDQPFQFDSAARAAGVNYLIGLKVATAEARPAWNRGDFFGTLYGK